MYSYFKRKTPLLVASKGVTASVNFQERSGPPDLLGELFQAGDFRPHQLKIPVTRFD